MRPLEQDRAEAVEWSRTFFPAIDGDPSAASVVPGYTPAWNVLRFVTNSTKVLFRLLDYIEMPHQYPMYQRRVPRAKPIPTPWIPGYAFLSFGPNDRWQQVLRMPGSIDFIGALEPGEMEDFISRLPDKLTKPSALSCIAPGTLVRIKNGPLMKFGTPVPVTWSDHYKVKVAMMMFGRPCADVTLMRADVEIVGK